MSENFSRFKKKYHIFRWIKSVLYGTAVGLLFAGLFLLLTKLSVLKVKPLFALPVGVGAGLLVGVLAYFLLRKSDVKLVRELDGKFHLEERLKTMFAYREDEGVMAELQRGDTEYALAQVPTKQYKIKRLWISIVSLLVGSATLVGAILFPVPQEVVPPEVVVPFSLTEVQRIGMQGLIEDVQKSKMEEPYRTEISDELEILLEKLEGITTRPDMEVAVGESMTKIWTSTANSSSMTEIANALWATGYEPAKALAKSINSGDWKKADDWGTYADFYDRFQTLYAYAQVEGEAPPEEEALWTDLKWKVEYSALRMESALTASQILQTDALYKAIYKLVTVEQADASGELLGFKPLSVKMETFTYEQSFEAVNNTLNTVAGDIYQAVSIQKENTNVGEFAMTKLSDLFLVPLPTFERPTLTGGNGSGEDSDGKEDEEQPEGAGGGVGGGATFGSDDYVLDPLTGEYVKYGELLAKYYALMNEKLEGETYSEAQKESIKKYFELLYGGIKEEK